MASAVLANHQNEPDWTQPRSGGGAKFMGKVPFSKSNPNPNHRFGNSKKRQFQHAADDVDESPAVTQSAASDDASSINRKPNIDFSGGAYVSFKIASYSKKELIELKNQLIVELEQIRKLKNRIESHDLHVRSSSSNFPLKKGSGIKKVTGSKRPLPPNFSKELKRLNPESGNLMKMCGQILTKLMKHKHGYIFNSPVDVVGLGLHDYLDIIKNPMDLGTVKSRLAKNFYDSPLDFAADVRLTFNNAMMYNPKGHEIYALADQQLTKFEELFRPDK
ncbi:transcription factor GTE7-like [Carica papaya]|uniref:transcription factor GTE7-like n=1 Tax=Carica papaya TaxID=3649 RepID=UPI000B8C8903|nr:transcription factor GTE7-like [Carica papaya]